jgi:hypothetical protein
MMPNQNLEKNCTSPGTIILLVIHDVLVNKVTLQYVFGQELFMLDISLN